MQVKAVNLPISIFTNNTGLYEDAVDGLLYVEL